METNQLINQLAVLSLGINRLVDDFTQKTGYIPSLREVKIDLTTAERRQNAGSYKAEVTL